MALLSPNEQAEAGADVRELILASAQTAVLLRATTGEQLYGTDDAPCAPVGEPFSLEFIPTPAEDLAQKIDATACVLPEADVHPEDRVQVGAEIYRVQTVKEERLFGVVTHKVIRLVKHHVG